MNETCSSVEDPSFSDPGTPRIHGMSPRTITRATASKLREVLGDQRSVARLSTAKDLTEYRNISRYFHARLALVARGLLSYELEEIFCSCLPDFYLQADRHHRRQVQDAFMTAHDWVETHLFAKVNFYVRSWYETPAGKFFRHEWHDAKKHRNLSRFPYPPGPSLPADMLSFGGLDGLRWTNSNLVDFWLPCLAGIETEPTHDGTTGWILGDEQPWYDLLNTVALKVIMLGTAAQVSVLDRPLSRDQVHPFFRSTFNHSPHGDLSKLNSMLVIKPAQPTKLLTLEGIKPYTNYWEEMTNIEMLDLVQTQTEILNRPPKHKIPCAPMFSPPPKRPRYLDFLPLPKGLPKQAQNDNIIDLEELGMENESGVQEDLPPLSYSSSFGMHSYAVPDDPPRVLPHVAAACENALVSGERVNLSLPPAVNAVSVKEPVAKFKKFLPLHQQMQNDKITNLEAASLVGECQDHRKSLRMEISHFDAVTVKAYETKRLAERELRHTEELEEMRVQAIATITEVWEKMDASHKSLEMMRLTPLPMEFIVGATVKESRVDNKPATQFETGDHFAEADKDKIVSLEAASLGGECQEHREDLRAQVAQFHAVMLNAYEKKLDAERALQHMEELEAKRAQVISTIKEAWEQTDASQKNLEKMRNFPVFGWGGT